MVCNMNAMQDDEQDFEVEDTFDDFGDSAPKDKKGIPKIAIIGGVVLLIIVVIFLFGGSSEEIESSRVSGGANVQQTAGTEELDPVMVEALESLNEDDKMQAEDMGDSFIPIPIAPAQVNTEDIMIEAEETDPLETWKAIQNERVQQEQFQEALVQTQQNMEEQQNQDMARQEAMGELAKAMSSQMMQIVESKTISNIEHYDITSVSGSSEGLGDAASYAAAAQARDQSAFNPYGQDEDMIEEEEVEVVKQLIPATKIEYAQTLTQANSDVDGPVLAELVTGPLKGARLLGSFSKEEEWLVIEFSTAVLDDVSYPISAIVLDPDTTLPAMATDINRRWFRRVILPTAAAFIEGMGSAVAQTSGTTVSVQAETVTEETEDLDTEEELGKAVEEAAREISEIIDEEGSDVETQVIVRSGTPIGVLFLSPVFEPTDDPQLGGGQSNSNNFTSSNSSNNSILNVQELLPTQ
ncbi:MAG: hypothetical protein CL600_00050 [Alteromonas sp.]|nr:hypothetical protein [Alteromonas sp.]